MDEELYREVMGVRMLHFYNDEPFLSAMSYKPREGDIILVSYPKCGSNWTHFIIWNILTRAEPITDIGEFSLMCPFIEVTGAGAAENPSRTGPVITHLPLRVFHPAKCAKYIYVARNPYDCAVSYYHFLKGLTPVTCTDVSFDKFLRLFLSGKVLYGDYFEHLLPWYEHRHDANVLFVTYEELKSDTRAQVLKIASFLGAEHASALLQDEGLVKRILKACSLENMRGLLKGKATDRMRKMVETASNKSSQAFAMLANMQIEQVETHEGSGFVRKGIVGDWKNYFTPEHIKLMKTWIEDKTRGSDVMTLWSGVDLPE